MRYIILTLCLILTSALFWGAETVESLTTKATMLENRIHVLEEEKSVIQLEIIKTSERIDVLEGVVIKLGDDQRALRNDLQNEINNLKTDLQSKVNALESKDYELTAQINEIQNNLDAHTNWAESESQRLQNELDKKNKSNNKKITFAYILAIAALGVAIAN